MYIYKSVATSAAAAAAKATLDPKKEEEEEENTAKVLCPKYLAADKVNMARPKLPGRVEYRKS